MRRLFLYVSGLLTVLTGEISAQQLLTFAGGDPVVSVETAKRDGNAVLLECRLASGADVPVRIEVLTDCLVRVRVAPDGVFATTLPEKDGFLKSDWPGAKFDYRDEAGRIQIETAGLSLRVDKKPFRLWFVRGGELFTSLVSESGISFNDRQARLCLESPGDEKFFGFGDQGSGWRPFYPPDRAPLDHRGRSLVMAGLSSEREYYTPFFMSSRGYGFFLNTLVKSFWDLAKREKDRWTIEIDEPRLDFYLVAGPDHKKILDRYTELAGRAPLMPRWVLGGRTSAETQGILVDGRIPEDGWNTHWYSQKQIEHQARSVRERREPSSALSGANSWWTIRTSFEFPAEIPEPEKMFALLKSLNFRVELWQRCALVEGDYPVYREAERRGWLALGPDGKPMICASKYGGPSALVDLTNPAAVKWWQGLTSEKDKLGTDAWFLDSASSGFIEAYPEALELKFHNGMTGRQLDNYYGPLYLKTVWDVLKRDLNGRRAVVSCRHQAYFAAGRYPYQELGDRGRQSPQEARIRYALNNGLSGIPFWNGAGFGCLGPPMMTAEEKVRFIPFTYSYWREASDTGCPLMRAMFLEYPDDPECYRTDSQFLYGKEFLIAPVLNEGDQWRNVYLPAGEWVDYWTREKYLGPGWKYIHVGVPPREQTDITGFTWTPVTRGAAPVLVRGGSIIPVGPLMEWVGQKPANPLTLDIYPNGESSFDLYEDDGETYAYETGASSITRFRCSEDAGGITVAIGPAEGNFEGKLPERDYILQVQVTTRPTSVKLGSQTLPEIKSYEQWRGAKSGWYYKMGNNQIGDRTLYVKLPTANTGRGATVRLEGALPIRFYRR